MPSTKTAPAENLDYRKLLKDATKTITVSLPEQSGTPEEIQEKNEAALKAVGWTGQPYTITPATRSRYSRYSGYYDSQPARAKFERKLTLKEIDRDGPALWKKHLAAVEKARKQRAKDIVKLRALQRKLGLPLYEEEDEQKAA